MKTLLALSGLFFFLFMGAAMADPEDTTYYQKTLATALTTSAKTTAVNVTLS